jgi:hypothetical protein
MTVEPDPPTTEPDPSPDAVTRIDAPAGTAGTRRNWVVEREVRCIRCAYDLRGQPVDAQCPECATPVAVSCAAPTTSGFAIASMVLGICSIVGCMAYGLPSLVCGILAIVFAGIGQRQVLDGRAAASSMGMAKAGRITGIIGLCLFGSWIAFAVIVLVMGGF